VRGSERARERERERVQRVNHSAAIITEVDVEIDEYTLRRRWMMVVYVCARVCVCVYVRTCDRE